ncbi:MAG: GIY-YIG nuclease family protein [Caulobacterales bacterium]|nr:GIY-YIG nuclease family protein [Caulobacterales bacterium]
MPSWVYILECADGSYYTGCTTHIEQRIGQHKAGVIPGYTSTRLPVECVYVAEFQHLYEAIAWERTIKRWSRAKKEALIAGAYDTGAQPSTSWKARAARPCVLRHGRCAACSG